MLSSRPKAGEKASSYKSDAHLKMELKKTAREKGLVINNISLVGGKWAGGGEPKDDRSGQTRRHSNYANSAMKVKPLSAVEKNKVFEDTHNQHQTHKYNYFRH